MLRPVAYSHSFSPVAASIAYRLSSYEPTYTVPSTTVGDEGTRSPVAYSHSFSSVAASIAYTLLSFEPTYTVPSVSCAVLVFRFNSLTVSVLRLIEAPREPPALSASIGAVPSSSAAELATTPAGTIDTTSSVDRTTALVARADGRGIDMDRTRVEHAAVRLPMSAANTTASPTGTVGIPPATAQLRSWPTFASMSPVQPTANPSAKRGAERATS